MALAAQAATEALMLSLEPDNLEALSKKLGGEWSDLQLRTLSANGPEAKRLRNEFRKAMLPPDAKVTFEDETPPEKYKHPLISDLMLQLRYIGSPIVASEKAKPR